MDRVDHHKTVRPDFLWDKSVFTLKNTFGLFGESSNIQYFICHKEEKW